MSDQEMYSNFEEEEQNIYETSIAESDNDEDKEEGFKVITKDIKNVNDYFGTSVNKGIEENNLQIQEKDELAEESRTITSDDIGKFFTMANLNIDDYNNVVQILYVKQPLHLLPNLKVMEIDNHIREALDAGEDVTLRGEPNESLVLCTGTRTYEVREAETSNTCLVVEDLKLFEDLNIKGDEGFHIEEREVAGSFNTYYELRECSPRLDKLISILEPSSFKGLEYESLIDTTTLYDWDRITDEVQASNGEILEALPALLIACMNGKYRLIAFEFEQRAVPLMLDLIEENSWKLDEIDEDESCESLIDIIPKEIFELLFQKYTEKSAKVRQDGKPLYRYDEKKSTKLLAEILLTASSSNSYDDFMQAWKIGCPEGMEPKEEYLYGSAVIVWNDQMKRREIVALIEKNLPDNLLKRLTELFNIKPKWTILEISPYISKFTTRTQDVNALLTKYARSSMKNGIKYYSSKHGK